MGRLPRRVSGSELVAGLLCHPRASSGGCSPSGFFVSEAEAHNRRAPPRPAPPRRAPPPPGRAPRSLLGGAHRRSWPRWLQEARRRARRAARAPRLAIGGGFRLRLSIPSAWPRPARRRSVAGRKAEGAAGTDPRWPSAWVPFLPSASSLIHCRAAERSREPARGLRALSPRGGRPPWRPWKS